MDSDKQCDIRRNKLITTEISKLDELINIIDTILNDMSLLNDTNDKTKNISHFYLIKIIIYLQLLEMILYLNLNKMAQKNINYFHYLNNRIVLQ